MRKRVWNLRLLVPALAVILAAATGCHHAKKPKTKPPPTPNEVLFERGKALMAERKFEKARTALTDIGKGDAQSPSLDPLVKIALADSYFYDEGIANTIEAQSRYTQFLTFYPSSPLAGYAQFQIAMCWFKQSPLPYHDQDNTHKAIDEFDKVHIVDPNSRFALAAAAMKDRCFEKLATHDYQVGVFYFKRKKWQGAISRFEGLLDSYPAFDQKDGVYYYLGLSLERAKNDAEARLYLQKLVHDYPTSRFAAKARREMPKSGS